MFDTDWQGNSAHCNPTGTQSDVGFVTTRTTREGLTLAIKCPSLQVTHITSPTTQWTELRIWLNYVQRVPF